MSRSDFKEGAMGRQIIDDVVETNKSRNMENYTRCKMIPTYMGYVNIGERRVELDSFKKRKDLNPITLIAPLTKGVEHFRINPGDAYIFTANENGEPVKSQVHPTVIRIIKVATALSINPNSDYSLCMTELVKGLCEMASIGYTLPMSLPTGSKTQEVISREINDYLLEIFKDDNVPFNTIVGEAKSESEMDRLLALAKAGAPDVR